MGKAEANKGGTYERPGGAQDATNLLRPSAVRSPERYKCGENIFELYHVSTQRSGLGGKAIKWHILIRGGYIL